MADKYETHEHDVLVIGAGGAGLRAAIEASNAGVSVGLVCKSLLGKAHTVMAEGGVAAAMGNVEPRDNWKVHFRDTMKGGRYLNQWRMAQLHAQEAPDRVNELEAWGALFDRTKDGKILQRNFGGHKYPRLAHVGDRTGLEMIRTLQQHGVHLGIKVYMECTVTRLLVDGDRIAGAFGYWRENGRFVLFTAKAIVLSTGGIGRMFKINSNSWECTGDGHALGYLAGAELMDLEFMQFHPTGMVWPPSVRGTLITEGVRGEGGTLRNKNQKRIMFDYIPELYKNETADNEAEADKWLAESTSGTASKARRTPDLLPRDIVARAIHTEVKAGRGSPHGGVFLDIATRRSAEDIKKKLPAMYHQFMELGDVDITKDPMEVGPTGHYAMGGLRVDPETQQTRIKGLFAAGECAAGMHGANRLGGNSLSDLLVFGRIAGHHASNYVKDAPAPKPHRPTPSKRPRRRRSRPSTPVMAARTRSCSTRTLKDDMQTHVGIIRTEEDLKKGLDALEKLKARVSRRQDRRQPALQLRLARGLRHAEHDHRRRGHVPSGPHAQREPRRARERRLPRDGQGPLRQGQHRVQVKGSEMDVAEVPLPDVPDEIKKVLEEKE